MTGRFDLPAPEGTCYTAADPIGSLLEVVRARNRISGFISHDLFADRRLHELHLPEPRTLAHLGRRAAVALGVTLEISTVLPLTLPQAWAHHLRRAGAEGIVYHLRHDPAAQYGYALFGPAGEHPGWPVKQSSEISSRQIAQFERATGLRVLPRPRLDQLTLIEPAGSH